MIVPCRTFGQERDERGLVVAEDDSAVDDADGVVLDDAATCHLAIPVFPGEDEADNYHILSLRLEDLVELGVHLEE